MAPNKLRADEALERKIYEKHSAFYLQALRAYAEEIREGRAEVALATVGADIDTMSI